jgi:hypothetical protein
MRALEWGNPALNMIAGPLVALKKHIHLAEPYQRWLEENRTVDRPGEDD